MPSSRTLLATVALGAALAAPSAASAAEGFTAVTTDGQVTHLQSDAIPGLKPAPIDITGLAAGESVVGLDRTPSGELLALTSAGRIDVLDASTGKATAKFAHPVTAAVDPNAPLTFAVAPDGASVRIIAPGHDIVVNLTTGAATSGPALTLDGAPVAPALDYGKDGRLVGVAKGAEAIQTAVGAGTLSSLGAVPYPAKEPLRTTVASDGSVWTIANLGLRGKQSRIVRYDPATGKFNGQNGTFLLRELTAVTADGPVADDHSRPTATFADRILTREVSRGHAYWKGLRVRMSEGGQTVASLRYRGKIVGFGLVTLDARGAGTFQFGQRKGLNATLKRLAAQHRRLIVHATMHDWAGNKRAYDIPVRLTLR